MNGKRASITQWVHADACVVRVEVDAIIPEDDPSEPCLEPQTIRWLDELQALADAGNIAELEKVGTVYVRKSA